MEKILIISLMLAMIVLVGCEKERNVYDLGIPSNETNSPSNIYLDSTNTTNELQLGIGNYTPDVEMIFRNNRDNEGALSWNGSHFDFEGNVTVGAKLLIDLMNDITNDVCDDIRQKQDKT